MKNKIQHINFEIRYAIAKIKRFFNETLPMELAFRLPKKVQLWCFIAVYGADGECPSREYKTKYDYFAKKHGIE